jgi:molybdate transport system ATP-binding protein
MSASDPRASVAHAESGVTNLPRRAGGLDAEVLLRLGRLRLDATVRIATGELVVLLGPNGAGKTTLLRALAGLVPLDGGRVVLDGTVLEDPAAGIRVQTEHRPVGVVFQDYLLFPHLSVLDNVAYGLRARGLGRAAARRDAAGWLERVGLASLAASKPGAISGGQAQRVALARTLATSPRLLLLDEPLAALDAATRVELRRELRRHLASFEGTRLLITHDHLEAVTLADRLLVLEDGRITHDGTPDEVNARPKSDYVAHLVGVNLFRGRADGGAVALADGGTLVAASAAGHSGPVFATVHPRAVALHRQRPEGSPRNVWQGTVRSVETVTSDSVRARIDGHPPMIAEVTRAAAVELLLAEGGPVWVSIKATEVAVYAD